jgi:hypothetical protein
VDQPLNLHSSQNVVEHILMPVGKGESIVCRAIDSNSGISILGPNGDPIPQMPGLSPRLDRTAFGAGAAGNYIAVFAHSLGTGAFQFSKVHQIETSIDKAAGSEVREGGLDVWRIHLKDGDFVKAEVEASNTTVLSLLNFDSAGLTATDYRHRTGSPKEIE